MLTSLPQVLLPSGGMEYHGETRGDERVLDDNECPLAIVMQHAKHRGQGKTHFHWQLSEGHVCWLQMANKHRIWLGSSMRVEGTSDTQMLLPKSLSMDNKMR